MAKKLFKPDLINPQGINNYPGSSFRCFTKGDTLPFKFIFNNSDGTALDVTNWEVYVVLSDTFADNNGCVPDTAQIVEVQIPLTDLASATFEGEVADTESQFLPAGLIYALAKYVTATGATHIIDMAVLEIYPNITPST